MSEAQEIRAKYEALSPYLNERLRRLWAGVEAGALGHGGIAIVAAATGLSRPTVSAGVREVQALADEPLGVAAPERQRRRGGGRKRLVEQDPSLLRDLEALVEPVTRGDPQSPLRWTCKSTQKLADQLWEQGHRVGARKVASLLQELRYSLQTNRKTREGASHPDRNQQFEYINAQVQAFQGRGQPVVSVDTKKKELVGNFRNGGREWQPCGHPEEVEVHDFPDKELGKAVPYGVYDMTANEGWVSVGTDHDTAQFACQSILTWWRKMGCTAYPQATELLITADGGGSNGSRSRLWKLSVQELANQTGLSITVCHFPPGTSKWNKIEHRMFCHITQNWRGRPLVSYGVIVALIGSTTTEKGLRIGAQLDQNSYPTGIKVSDDEIATVRIERAEFHGEWNYTILPTAAAK